MMEDLLSYLLEVVRSGLAELGGNVPPDVFNDIQIRTVRWPVHDCNVIVLEGHTRCS